MRSRWHEFWVKWSGQVNLVRTISKEISKKRLNSARLALNNSKTIKNVRVQTSQNRCLKLTSSVGWFSNDLELKIFFEMHKLIILTLYVDITIHILSSIDLGWYRERNFSPILEISVPELDTRANEEILSVSQDRIQPDKESTKTLIKNSISPENALESEKNCQQLKKAVEKRIEIERVDPVKENKTIAKKLNASVSNLTQKNFNMTF